MKNELNIDGVTYIRKDTIKDDSQKWLELKEIVSQSLTDIEKVNKIIDSYINNVDLKQEAQRTEERHKTDKETILKNTSQVIYENIYVKDGYLRSGRNGLMVSIDDMKKMTDAVNSSNITNSFIKEWSKKLNRTTATIKKIIFNIKKGTFTPFLQENNNSTYRKEADKFVVIESAKRPYHIRKLLDDGVFVMENNRLSAFTVHDVFKIRQKIINKDVTVGRANIVRKELNLPQQIFERIVYSLEEGVFDTWLNEWASKFNSSLDPIVKKKVSAQNNPEKRKEMGFYGTVIS